MSHFFNIFSVGAMAMKIIRHSEITFPIAAWGRRVGLGSGLDEYGQVGSGNSSLAVRYFPPYPCSTWRGVAFEIA